MEDKNILEYEKYDFLSENTSHINTSQLKKE